jgi:polyphosphate kinase
MGKKILKLLWRDLAWLSFNERVMQEAKDSDNHPFDRLRFLGIFSNNPDESSGSG